MNLSVDDLILCNRVFNLFEIYLCFTSKAICDIMLMVHISVTLASKLQAYYWHACMIDCKS